MEPAPETPSTQALLTLQRAEVALVKADLAAPGARSADLHLLRYLLGFARLTRFQPGAAEHGLNQRPEVDVAAEVEPLRAEVLTQLAGPIVAERDPLRVMRTAVEAGERLHGRLHTARAAMADRHANDFSAAELDAECGRKRLILAAGGGGGAGWVYLGAGRRMDQEGLEPSYLIGSSFGSIFGVMRSIDVKPDWDAYVALARGLDRRELFSAARMKRRHGLPGLLALRLRSSIGHLYADDQRIADLAIPYESVVDRKSVV